MDTKDIIINELTEANRVQGVSKSMNTPVLDGRPSLRKSSNSLVYKRDNVKKISPFKVFKAANHGMKNAKMRSRTVTCHRSTSHFGVFHSMVSSFNGRRPE
jgi:hypothetical protein